MIAPVKEIFDIICRLSMRDPELFIFDTKIYQEATFPRHIVDDYLNELLLLGFIEEKLPRLSGNNFRLYHLTKRGAEECGTNPNLT